MLVMLINITSVLVYNTLEECKHFVNTLYSSESVEKHFFLTDKRLLLLMKHYWKFTVVADIVSTYLYSLKYLLNGNIISICFSKV